MFSLTVSVWESFPYSALSQAPTAPQDESDPYSLFISADFMESPRQLAWIQAQTPQMSTLRHLDPPF